MKFKKNLKVRRNLLLQAVEEKKKKKKVGGGYQTIKLLLTGTEAVLIIIKLFVSYPDKIVQMKHQKVCIIKIFFTMTIIV